jgi:hypothetical protein
MRFGSVQDPRRFTPAQRAGLGDPIPGCNCRSAIPAPPSLVDAVQGKPVTSEYDAQLARQAALNAERERRRVAAGPVDTTPPPIENLAQAIRTARGTAPAASVPMTRRDQEIPLPDLQAAIRAARQ